MSVVTEPGVYLDMDEQAYHSSPALSSTGARAILKSPARFQWEREHPVFKDVFDVGSALHTLVLGTGWEVDVLDFDDWRTKAAQAAKAESRAAGRIPLLVKDFEPVKAMALSVLAHPTARGLFERDGAFEPSLFADDPATGVPMRCRFDFLPDLTDDTTIAVDLKSAISADPDDFGRDAAKFGYDVQDCWYRNVLRLARGDVDIEFAFVVVEKSAPYLVSVVQLDAEFEVIGAQRVRRAIDVFAECQASGEWPGYGEGTHFVGPPRWLAHQEGLVL